MDEEENINLLTDQIQGLVRELMDRPDKIEVMDIYFSKMDRIYQRIELLKIQRISKYC